MNEKPHTHEITVRNWGYAWHLNYGDQDDTRDKPLRWPWDSEEAYIKRCATRLRRHIKKLVIAHDRVSKAQAYAVVPVPNLRENTGTEKWGSELF